MLERMEAKTENRFTKIQQLGSGSFGNVWLVRSNFSFKSYVVKEMSERCKDGKEKELAINEANILAKLKHKNIIRYKDAYFDDDRLCIVMEYADDGDLFTKIRKQDGKKFPTEQILDWFVQLTIAVKYMHDEKILHRDLKSQNIFLTTTGILKVGDFGISRILGCTSDHAQTAVGTPYYLSPEICLRKPYNQKSDIWSLGVILYEMSMLGYPFVGKNLSELIGNILSGNYSPVTKDVTPLINDLILVLLQVEPANRPSAKQILSIPPVNKIMKDFLAKMRHMEGQNRKESVESPAIMRKRDKSFRYGVRFDLTMQDAMFEGQSNEAARSQIEVTGCEDSGIVVPTCCVDPRCNFAANERREMMGHGEKHGSLSRNIDSVKKQTETKFNTEADKRTEIVKSKENTLPCFAECDARKRTFVIKGSENIVNKNACDVSKRTENRTKMSFDVTRYTSRYEEVKIKDYNDCNRLEQQCDDVTTCANGDQTVLGKRRNSVADSSVHGTKVRILGNTNEGMQGSREVENVGSRADDTVSLKSASHIYECVQESRREEDSRNYDLLDKHRTRTDSKSLEPLEERRKSRSISHLSPRFRTRVLSRIRNFSLESAETCKKLGDLQNDEDADSSDQKIHGKTFRICKESRHVDATLFNQESADINQANDGFSRIANAIQTWDEVVGDELETASNKMLIFIDDDKFFKIDQENLVKPRRDGPNSTEYPKDGTTKQLKDAVDIKCIDQEINEKLMKPKNLVKPRRDDLKSVSCQNGGMVKQTEDVVESTDHGTDEILMKPDSLVKPRRDGLTSVRCQEDGTKKQPEDAVDIEYTDHGISEIKMKPKYRWSKARMNSLIDELKSSLVARIGENILTETCRYLRKRKLALLDDKVFDSMTVILGEKMVDCLPEICRLLLLEKKIEMDS
eukprot:Seg1093.1 transcript_id=Seg1093.1/GoldUCD/mRNA.D3Y31 product="Serine/threonine-protein kinase Nek1" protein_id=Seg1093.1/GoldUCD/D3Y31